MTAVSAPVESVMASALAITTDTTITYGYVALPQLSISPRPTFKVSDCIETLLAYFKLSYVKRVPYL